MYRMMSLREMEVNEMRIAYTNNKAVILNKDGYQVCDLEPVLRVQNLYVNDLNDIIQIFGEHTSNSVEEDTAILEMLTVEME
jgi:hypothetical protein